MGPYAFEGWQQYYYTLTPSTVTWTGQIAYDSTSSPDAQYMLVPATPYYSNRTQPLKASLPLVSVYCIRYGPRKELTMRSGQRGNGWFELERAYAATTADQEHQETSLRTRWAYLTTLHADVEFRMERIDCTVNGG